MRMLSAYLKWAPDDNFGMNNACHVQLSVYVPLKCKLMTND